VKRGDDDEEDAHVYLHCTDHTAYTHCPGFLIALWYVVILNCFV